MKTLLLLTSVLAGISAYEVCTPENRCADAPVAEAEQPKSKDETSCLTDCKVREWLDDFETRLKPARFEEEKASFALFTNQTARNVETSKEKSLILSNLFADASAQAFEGFDLSKIRDRNVKRDIQYILHYHTGSTPEEREKNAELSTEISARFLLSKICPAALPDNCDDSDKIPFDPDANEIMKSSRNETELRILWQRWHQVAGKPSRDAFFKLLELRKKQDRRVGTNTLTGGLLQPYIDDQPSIYADLLNLYSEVIPFYEDLHAYVRHELRKFYGDAVVPRNATIPAHILGNMFADDWLNIYHLVEPYPKAAPKKPSLAEAMKAQNWTPKKMFRMAEYFFKSIGLPPLPPSFWNNSTFERPKDGRSVACGGSAHHIGVQEVRAHMCTLLNAYDYRTAYLVLGNLYNILASEKQTPLQQAGVNSGFLAAFGDAVLLSAKRDVYLKHIGLLENSYTPSFEAEINDLLFEALETFPYLPDSFVLDTWRLSVFENSDENPVSPKDANDEYWALRKDLQGFHAPVDRAPDDFDPPARAHIAGFVPATQLIVGAFLQYDIHSALCKEGHPSTCSIFNDKEAGAKLWNVLEMGRSKPWPEVLRAITGRSKLSAQPLLEYYSKLAKWLREENTKNGVCIGWGKVYPKGLKVNGPRC